MAQLLKCNFCQKVCGEADSLAFVEDCRCDDCQVKFGYYPAMARHFKSTIKDDHDLFLAFMEKSEKKIENYIENLYKEYPEEMIMREQNELSVSARQESIEQKLEIDKLSQEEKIKKLKADKEIK